MLDKMTNRLDFHGTALILRAERQRAIASNIANADTPGYVARDFKFSDALSEATATRSAGADAASGSTISGVTRQVLSGVVGTAGATDPRHIPVPVTRSGGSALDARGTLGYAVQTQPSLDDNSVDMNRERAAFADNAVRYEATLRFINGNAKTMLSAIQGQ
ncbi:flagellar basal body rod protein FlgB [Acidovorax sp.]|uniref:flagellar basal body rod protein FlgB n=1 Tax=Acidovorax sp. TaxID=1872122 RepID=UPI00391A5ED4